MRTHKFKAFYKDKIVYFTLQEAMDIDHESYTDDEWAFMRAEHKFQCTESIDKDNKEIYEADCIQFCENECYYAEWDWRNGKYYLQHTKFSAIRVDDFSYASHGKIIGNIYINPELLKK